MAVFILSTPNYLPMRVSRPTPVCRPVTRPLTLVQQQQQQRQQQRISSSGTPQSFRRVEKRPIILPRQQQQHQQQQQPQQQQQRQQEQQQQQEGQDQQWIEELLGIGSSDEHRVRKRERLNHLTAEEKLRRRKYKNRMAAQTARDRKKQRTGKLEEAVRRLYDENATLREENSRLKKSCEELKSRNEQLAQALRSEPRSEAESVISPSVGSAVSIRGPQQRDQARILDEIGPLDEECCGAHPAHADLAPELGRFCEKILDETAGPATPLGIAEPESEESRRTPPLGRAASHIAVAAAAADYSSDMEQPPPAPLPAAPNVQCTEFFDVTDVSNTTVAAAASACDSEYSLSFAACASSPPPANFPSPSATNSLSPTCTSHSVSSTADYSGCLLPLADSSVSYDSICDELVDFCSPLINDCDPMLSLQAWEDFSPATPYSPCSC